MATANHLYEVDPFRFETLRHPTVDVTVRAEVFKAIGKPDDVSSTCGAYFNTIYHRFPILSQKRFYDCLPTIFDGTSDASFSALCLSLHLVQQRPSISQRESMHTALYVKVKSILSLLEATGFVSLEVVQCRLLVTFYEMGHALYPAASISIATCARIARVLCLHKRNTHVVGEVSNGINSEERNRVWWGVICLDRSALSFQCPRTCCLMQSRFINICNGDSIFAAEDPKGQDPLPIEDAAWAENVGLPTHLLDCLV
jgi:hypothetical protein